MSPAFNFGMVCLAVGFVGWIVFGFFGGLLGLLYRIPGLVALGGFFGLLFLLGIALVATVVGYGIYLDKTGSRGPVVTYENVAVMAKFAILPTGETVTMYYDSLPDLKYFVCLDLGDGKMTEFKTSFEVFNIVGEGMTGTAECQGSWLGGFRVALAP